MADHCRVSAAVRLFCALLVCLLVLAACRDRSGGPEEELRAAIAQASDAAEKRDLRALSGFLCFNYHDEQGRDREAILGMLRYYFLGHQSIYLLIRTGAIELTGDEAQAVVLVAMAGEPLTDPNEPSFVRASLYRFEFDFVLEKGIWKVCRSSWKRADLRDFLLART